MSGFGKQTYYVLLLYMGKVSMNKSKLDEDDWGYSEYQSRRDETKQRQIEKRNRKNTKRRLKRDQHEID